MKVNNELLFAKTYSVDSFDIIQAMSAAEYQNFFEQSLEPRLEILQALNLSS